MTALVQYAYDSFTGDNVSSMDRLPTLIPVAGYDRRFDAHQHSGLSDGAKVTSWPDRAGSGTTLTASASGVTGATAPSMATVGQERVVRFNGTTDAIGQLYTNPEPLTLSLAFYLSQPSPNAWLVSVSDVGMNALFVSAENRVLWWGQARKSGPELKPGWHILSVSADGAQATIRLDGDSTTSTTGVGGAYARNRITLAGATANASRGRFDLAELIHWPRALGAGELDTVHSTLRARYGI